MKILRRLLYPFGLLYGGITSVRNFLFDHNILKSTEFEIPVIAIGNLNVGGTGKTPQVEYLARLLSPYYKVAILSRGYKRSSKGFFLADEKSTAAMLGDEPFQYHRKFPEISVAVDANRTEGIQNILKLRPKTEVILLDDAYQHRKVKAGFYILLTSYSDLFSDDLMLPAGNLRESKSGANRAAIVIVTKCPSDLSKEQQQKVKSKLALAKNQQLFFSTIEYDEFVFSETNSISVEEVKLKDKTLLAGIAKPKYFFDFLKKPSDTLLEFPDHHNFNNSEINLIKTKAQENLVITTEKDYVRLYDSVVSDNLYYLPIKSAFIKDKELFDNNILGFVKDFPKN